MKGLITIAAIVLTVILGVKIASADIRTYIVDDTDIKVEDVIINIDGERINGVEVTAEIENHGVINYLVFEYDNEIYYVMKDGSVHHTLPLSFCAKSTNAIMQ